MAAFSIKKKTIGECYFNTHPTGIGLSNDFKEPVLVINPRYEQVLKIETACHLIYPFLKNLKFKDVMFMFIIRFKPKS